MPYEEVVSSRSRLVYLILNRLLKYSFVRQPLYTYTPFLTPILLYKNESKLLDAPAFNNIGVNILEMATDAVLEIFEAIFGTQ